MKSTGYLQGVVENGFSIFVPFEDVKLLERHEINEFEVNIDDGRTITAAQRRKIFALIHDITEFVSAPPPSASEREHNETLRQMQLLFVMNRTSSEAVRRQLTYHFCNLSQAELFSLSSVDLTTARHFIDYLVELCVVHAIPCLDTLLNRAEDIGRYIYTSCLHRRCAICGKDADLHHVDRVGIGRNRNEIIQIGMRVQPLCREHHRECHKMPQEDFDARYHLECVRVDEHMATELGLGKLA